MDTPLRRAHNGTQERPWSKPEILAGLKEFYRQYNRYPTAREIDAFGFLPSSRSIQRSFGGLVALRSALIPESHTDFTRGSYRSAKAKATWHRAALYEEEFYNFLITRFEAVAVHEHKIMRPGNVASDYYIYLDEDSGIVIDLFYAADLFSLSNVVNIKLKRYYSLPFETYFILVGNDGIDIASINLMLANRKTPLPSHISVDTEINFKVSTVNRILSRSKYKKV